MASYAFRVDECSCNLHEADGWHLIAIHQLICSGILEWHPALQPKLGRAPPPHPTGSPNTVETQVECQFGEVHFWHDRGSVSRIHYWWMGGGYWSIQDPSHSTLAGPNHSDRAPQLFGFCQFLPQAHVGVISYHLALSQVTKGAAKDKLFWSKDKLFWSKYQQKAFVELKHRLCLAPVLTLPDLKQPFEIKTYASDYAIGVVLNQWGYPVAYHSETLSDIVWKYPTCNKEMYSIV